MRQRELLPRGLRGLGLGLGLNVLTYAVGHRPANSLVVDSLLTGKNQGKIMFALAQIQVLRATLEARSIGRAMSEFHAPRPVLSLPHSYRSMVQV